MVNMKTCKYTFCQGIIDRFDTFITFPDDTYAHLHCYIKVATQVSQRKEELNKFDHA